MSKAKSFSIIIFGNDDLLLEQAIESISKQTIRDIQIIFLSTGNKEKRGKLSEKYRYLQFCFSKTQHLVAEYFEKVSAPYVLCLASNERLLTPNALQEYQSAFERNPNAVIVISNPVVTNSMGEVLYSSSIAKNKILNSSDLLTPIIFKADGRGVAFRVPAYTANLPKTLIEILITVSKKGGIFPLDANLHTINEKNLPSSTRLKNSFRKIWLNYFILGKKSGAVSALANYHQLLAQEPSFSIVRRFWHKNFSILLGPKSIIRGWVFAVLNTLYLWVIDLIGIIGRILFYLSKAGENIKQNKTRFALISHILPPSPSGQSVVIERLLRDVSMEDYILINTHPVNDTKSLITPLPAKTHHLQEKTSADKFFGFQSLFVLTNIVKSFIRGWKIAKIANREGCGVLIGCTGDLIDFPAAYFASVFTHAKYYAYYFDDYRFQWIDKKRRLFASFTERVLLRKMNGAIAPNEFLQKQILDRKFIRTKVVPNPANDPVPTSHGNIIKPPFRIIYTGSVYHVNAQAIKNIIGALDLLDGKQIELHIYTSQPKDLLQEYGISGKNVKYYFHIPPDEIIKIQENAFLLLIPLSLNSPIPEVVHTSAPGKLGDYLASGTPILALVPGDSFVSKYLQEKNCGLVVSSNDPGQIAKQILDLLGSPKVRQELARNAFQAAKEDFDRLDAQKNLLSFIKNNEKKPGVLHVSATDLAGKEFNGYMLGERLRKNNFHSYLSVTHAMSNSPYVYEYGSGAYKKTVDSLSQYILDELSIQSLFPCYREKSLLPKNLLKSEIDIIHLQLIHAAPFFNLRIIPSLSRKFPTVYTLHDQWAYTGHCIHPLECEGWLSGCHNCPDLERNIAMRKDRAAYMYRQKQQIFAESKVHLVVSSQWMYERVMKSPIMSHLPCTVIPFGIDYEVFYPEDKDKSREYLNIPSNNKVLFFRSAPGNIYKGMEYINKALEFIHQKDVTILTTDFIGAFEEFKEKFHFIELGWVNDQNLLRKFLSAADIFLSPSLAESFGMMPLEAMACGTPTIVFKGTGLEKLTDSPNIGTAVDYKDGRALGIAVEEMINNPEELNKRSRNGINFVRENYSIENYVRQHIHLYNSLL